MSRSKRVRRRAAVTIIHRAGPAILERYPLSDGLHGITHSQAVRRAVLARLTDDPRARLTLAVADGVVIGWAAVAPSFGRWRLLPTVRELGLEVAREWRPGTTVARALLATALADPRTEDEVLLAFALPSSWDLAYKPVHPAVYRRMIAMALRRYGFAPIITDDPEVCDVPEAALFLRAGARVPAPVLAAVLEARVRPPLAPSQRIHLPVTAA